MIYKKLIWVAILGHLAQVTHSEEGVNVCFSSEDDLAITRKQVDKERADRDKLAHAIISCVSQCTQSLVVLNQSENPHDPKLISQHSAAMVQALGNMIHEFHEYGRSPHRTADVTLAEECVQELVPAICKSLQKLLAPPRDQASVAY